MHVPTGLKDTEIAKLSTSVDALSPNPRHARWAHLSLCVLDATFSIGLRYNAVVVPVVRRYARSQSLAPVLIEGPGLLEKVSPRENEQSLSQFLSSIGTISDDDLATQLGSKNRTSSRGGILKASASRQIAEVLVAAEVESLSDVAVLLADAARTVRVEEDLRRIAGGGSRGIRTSYLWMLAGDDNHVKPDRHVLKWLGGVLGRQVSVTEARSLLSAVAKELQISPWSVDHAIWSKMTRRT
ncbi:hypothetical protein QFZ50_000247 [Arthrobacter agilis]|nr:hypothetical protein [Arthrobacter agilis]